VLFSGHKEKQNLAASQGYLCWKKGCNQYFNCIETLQTHFKEIHGKPLSTNSDCKNNVVWHHAVFYQHQILEIMLFVGLRWSIL